MTLVSFAEIEAASGRIAGRVLRTPAVRSDSLSRATGADIVLKLDNLQATGAFKERGAANRLALLTPAEAARGVIAMSAGNHAQAVARHAHLLGVAATIVMPKFTPTTKVTRTASWGARVVLHGESLAEAAAHAHHLAETEGLVFIHPYDDPGIIAGQGTLALELLQDFPDLDVLVIPIGGGGLLAGCATAARAMKPGIEIIGVEVEAYSAMAQRLAGEPVSVGGQTIAEGMAVRDVGELPFTTLKTLGIEVLIVPEATVSDCAGMTGGPLTAIVTVAGGEVASPSKAVKAKLSVPVVPSFTYE